MKLFKYNKMSLVWIFKWNEYLKNEVVKLKVKLNIRLVLNKNFSNSYKYQIEIIKDNTCISVQNWNNYMNLIDWVHTFLIKNKLVDKEEILDFDLDFENIEDIFNEEVKENKIVQNVWQENLKKLNETELKNLKIGLNNFFSNNKFINYDLIIEKSGVIAIFWDQKEVFKTDYSLDFIKQFLIKYLYHLPQINKNNLPEAIIIFFNSWKILNISILNFLDDVNWLNDFENNHNDTENTFSLCDWDLFVNEASLNCFVEDLFYMNKINKVQQICI